MSDDRALLDKFVESKNVFNPDILDCIANLSNDEVFTPPKLVNEVLDTLPPEIWHDSKITFLDPACKSGVWLREVTKRLINGLADEIPDLQERIDHILHKQVFGIAITELTSLLSRRSLYCSKYPNGRYSISRFDDVSGNIWYQNIDHKWKNGRCVLCGANQSEYDRSEDKNSYAYGFIHLDPHYWEEVFGVKFDVIIGNPPYQLSTGGGGDNGGQARPIYQYFVEAAMKLSPRYITMITPSRWIAGGMGLEAYRRSMLENRHITRMVDYTQSSKCFTGVYIPGGVSYFLWERDRTEMCEYTYIDGDSITTAVRNLNENSVFIRDNRSVGIVSKVKSMSSRTIDTIMSSLGPFGLGSSTRGRALGDTGDLLLLSSAGRSYIDPDEVNQGMQYIGCWKTVIGKATSGSGASADKNGMRKVIATIDVLPPNSVCTFSYFIAGSFNDKNSADNCAKYLKTKFARFLLLQCLSSINISKEKFQYVPLQDFSKPWTDDELYKKYGLSQEEIDYIESTIKEMK